MRLRLLVNVLLTVIFIFILSLGISVAWENAPFLGEINTNDINVRSDATIGSKVICTLDKGEQVEVVSESYQWYKIHLPTHILVYLKGSLADCIKYQESIESNKEVCLSAKVLRDRVNVRVSPDESSAIVGIADKNEIINVRGEADGWYKIEPIQNSFGWVHKKFLNKVVKATPVNKNEDKKESLSQNENIVLKGIINPYGMVFKRVATHKLITADNKVFLLKGNKATLDALNRNKVKVIGKIISPPKAKYPIVEVIIIEAEN